MDSERQGPLDVLYRIKGARMYEPPYLEHCPKCGVEAKIIFTLLIGAPDENDEVKACKACCNEYLNRLWEWVP